MPFNVSQTDDQLLFITEDLRLGFNKTNGALVFLSWAGGKESFVGHGELRAGLDARLGDVWLGQEHAARFLNHAVEEVAGWTQITITVGLGPLRLHDVYTVEGPLVERRVVVENAGQEEVRLNGLRMIVPWARIGALEECRFEAPGTAVRPRLPLAIAAQERLGHPPSEVFAPAARARWGLPMEDAPDATPGLLAVHNPARQETLLCWYSIANARRGLERSTNSGGCPASVRDRQVEAATPRLDGNGQAVSLIHEPILAGWLAPGQTLQANTQYLIPHRGTWEEALTAFRAFYPRTGILPPLYGEPPAWVREAVIYEVHPGQYGGFRGLAEAVPCLAGVGFNVLYLLPIWPYDNRNGRVWDENWLGGGSPYAIRDFESFEPTLGTAEDFRHLVDVAHAHGMRVLLDFVSQGCATDARYVTEHPEWFCRDEAGNLVSSHGWIDTYSFDWANPDYHEYMLNWSLRWLREYGFDGYRVDAPHGKEPNWDRWIPYHASATNLGVVRLLERLQAGVKAINPEAVLMCELFGPLFVKSHDLACDYLPWAQTHQLLASRLTPWEWSEYMRDHRAALPEGAVRVCFTETHDTRGSDPPAYGLRGSQLARAGFAALVLAGFTPMVWAGQERGQEDFYRRVFAARRQSPALLRGEVLYNAVRCSDRELADPGRPLGEAWVLAVIRRHEDEVVLGVISFFPEKRSYRFGLPVEEPVRAVRPGLGLEPEASYRLHDLLTGEDWDEYGRRVWTGAELAHFILTPVPFQPYFLRICRASNNQRRN